MLITAKTEIKGIRLELSVTEAKQCLENPGKIQTELRTVLNLYDIELEPEQIVKDKKLFSCPWCGKEYKFQAHLNRHTEKCPNHPGRGPEPSP